ncbi:Asp23/Gls24 family envelope stress response protein [Nocardia shimofusensis]|uniref:Asp23/Gls24 family envelope stress response protein n=1 Tax=Nocardia shimofusensis TaxID=228596 RepID=UPI0008336EB1|nr:Asp23/Gls24 family envelope stress response protein [Nocardia shimofusensis]
MSAPAHPVADRDGADGRADRIAAAVVAVPGVAALHPGLFGEVATYLPGRRVAGVRVREHGVDIHVSVRFGVPIRQVAERIRTAVGAIESGPIAVTVEDVVPPADSDDGA